MVYREISHRRRRAFSHAPLSVSARGASARLVLPAPAQDPHVYREAGLYYYTESSPSGVFVRVLRDFRDFASADRQRVWTPARRGPASHNLWAPELHRIDGRYYIYFAADDGANENHRMWVLGATTDDPAGDYELLGTLDTQGWAIDGTTFLDGCGERFFVWSGWPGDQDGQQNLYVARMKTPTALATPRVLLTRPDQPWERHGLPLCEGPQVLQRAGRTFIIYSASGSWTEDYGLGLLEHIGGDLANPRSWRKHAPVFSKNRHAWGVGHCGFATTASGQDWILYHAKTSRRPGWTDREVRAQPFTWDADGAPVFGAPLPCGAADIPASPTRAAQALFAAGR
ncbi:MAG TPA: glycoside hydrolase family 43 protein [Opitutus sp.]|nr:glycoside hydrolase family 43 protein [Opitutus sp.]